MSGTTNTSINENGLAVKAIQSMAHAREQFDDGEISADDFLEKLKKADDNLSKRITQLFNQRSDLVVYQSRSAPDAEDSTIDRISAKHYRESDAPEGFLSPDYDRYDHSIRVLNAIKDSHPETKNIDLDEAVKIIAENQGAPATEENELKLVAAHTTIHWNIRNLNDDHVDTLQNALKLIPGDDFNKLKLYADQIAQHPENDPIPHRNAFKKLNLENNLINAIEQKAQEEIAYGTMTKTRPSEEYLMWETEKQEEIVEAVENDPDLLTKLSQVKAWKEIENETEILQQQAIKHEIALDFAKIYSDVYGVEIKDSEIHTLYTSVRQQMNETGFIGQARGIPGFSQDDHVFLKHTPSHEFNTEDAINTSADAAKDLLLTVNEELRHTVDMRYIDMLANGQMPKDHPALEHTTKIFFNQSYYISSDGPAPAGKTEEDVIRGYETQYTERTAKDAAGYIAGYITDYALYPQDENTTPPKQEAATTDLNENILEIQSPLSITGPPRMK